MDLVIGDRTWNVDLDDKIGGGSFGAVYAATSDAYEAAVKLVPKDAGAQRELLLADDLSGVANIVPVYSVGETGDSWAIVMPRAEQSLRKFLCTIDGPLDPTLALPILLDLAQALVSLEKNGVVHRDLKPENILFLDGHWCLTDFGISRYAAATTAIDTWKLSKTPLYAAPEQWREERATSATDVYAFGVIAFEMLSGQWPFDGPDLRSQHLNEAPARLSASIITPLRSIVDECLIKAPQARPAPSRLLARLQKQVETEAPSGGAAALIAANQAEVQRISEEARRASAAQTESERRAELFGASCQAFLQVEASLAGLIHANASTASHGWPIRLGTARLDMVPPTKSDATGRVPFDVIAHAEIRVDQASAPGGNYVGRAHSLWYCDAWEEGRYAWFETAFMRHPLMRDQGSTFSAGGIFLPFSAAPPDEAAQQALGAGMGTYQIAWPFTRLIDEELDDFVNRWTEWFALCSEGRLSRPSQMPERSITESWRR